MSSGLVIGSPNASKGAPTTIGNLDSPLVASVDPRGLVTPWPNGWSLDWWIGAEDRWRIPAREVAARQRLIEGSPVVETALRIPGGDALQRAYAMRRSSLDNGGELVIVEVENSSKVPVAVAFAVGPQDAEGGATIEHIDLHEEVIVTVDGHVALLLPKPPARSCASTSGSEDTASLVMAGEAKERWPGPVRCAGGLAQAAFVYPLAHGTSLQVALPLESRPYRPAGRSSRRSRLRRQAEEPTPSFPQAVPGAVDVARGWSAQTGRGMRLELPDSRLAEGVKASLCSLLLLHGSDRITEVSGQGSWHQLGPEDAAHLLHALDLYGFHGDVAGAIALSVGSPQLGEGLLSPRRSEDPLIADAALLWTLAQHWRLTRDRKLVEAMADPVAGSANRLASSLRSRSRKPGSRRKVGQRNSSDDAPPNGLWKVAGLQAAAQLLAAAGQPKAAQDAARLAANAAEPFEGIQANVVLTADRAGYGDRASGEADPGRRPATRIASSEPATDGGALHQDKGSRADDLSPYQAIQLASTELLARDPRCLERFASLLDAASPTWTWPADVCSHSPDERSCNVYDARVAPELLRFVRNLLVRETARAEQQTEVNQRAGGVLGDPAGGLALATLVPDAWLGQGWEVHDAPTAYGPLSYAVRWHGERPALLWELQPHRDEGDAPGDDNTAPAPRLTAPGLDPMWSSTDLTGEALLALAPTST